MALDETLIKDSLKELIGEEFTYKYNGIGFNIKVEDVFWNTYNITYIKDRVKQVSIRIRLRNLESNRVHVEVVNFIFTEDVKECGNNFYKESIVKALVLAINEGKIIK